MVIYPNSTSEVLGKKLKRVMNTFCTNVTDLESISNRSSYNFDAVVLEY